MRAHTQFICTHKSPYLVTDYVCACCVNMCVHTCVVHPSDNILEDACLLACLFDALTH